MKRALAALALVFPAACTSEHNIGSACEEGLCESNALGLRVPCLIDTSATLAQDTVSGARDPFCVNYEAELDRGLAACRMYVAFRDGTSCADADLQSYAGDLTSSPECELPQLLPGARAPTGGRATGWYFDGPVAATDPCWEVARYRVRFNGELDVEARVQCTTALAHFSDVPATLRRGAAPVSVPPDRCGGLLPLPTPMPEDIGAGCATRVKPMDDFIVGKMYVDTRTQQCTSGVCLVDTLLACKPPNDCSQEIDFSVATYCSCRCDAPAGSRELCECPEGFGCFDVLQGEVPDSLAGGYCVRLE